MDLQRPDPSRSRRLAAAVAFGALGVALVLLVKPYLAGARGGGHPSTAPAESRAADAEAQKAVAWREDYAAAFAEAGERKMPVLLRFTASWCVPCRVMDANVFPDERVMDAVSERVIPLMIDIDREGSADIARRYGVSGVPTLLLINPSGKELARAGFMSAEQLVAFLRASR